MAEKLKITLSIANRVYPMRVGIAEEFFVREAAKLLNERMQKFRQDLEVTDPQDLLVMVAIDCIASNLKLNQNYKNLQEAVFQKIGALDELLTATQSE
jgi:cell division protein ZapA